MNYLRYDNYKLLSNSTSTVDDVIIFTHFGTGVPTLKIRDGGTHFQ